MKLIVACDPNGGIGYNNRLPWTNLQGDLPRFKNLTQGQVVVMGRNTWDSLPKKPLLGRLNFIVTSQQLNLPFGAISVAVPATSRILFLKLGVFSTYVAKSCGTN